MDRFLFAGNSVYELWSEFFAVKNEDDEVELLVWRRHRRQTRLQGSCGRKGNLLVDFRLPNCQVVLPMEREKWR